MRNWWEYATRRVCPKGYAQRRIPDHPEADSPGYVYEHRLFAEAALGKPIPAGAVVHHVNGDGADSRPGNLVLCNDNSYHRLLHLRARAFEATGNPAARQCIFCHEWEETTDNMQRLQASFAHRGCRRDYNRRGNARRRKARR